MIIRARMWPHNPSREYEARLLQAYKRIKGIEGMRKALVGFKSGPGLPGGEIRGERCSWQDELPNIPFLCWIHIYGHWSPQYPPSAC